MSGISNLEASVLEHTSNNGRYVTDEISVIEMASKRGLLCDYGPQRIADGMHYLTITLKGREALSEWRSKQPKPPKPKRQSREFRAWRSYVEACGNMEFSHFHREIWPGYEYF